MTDVVVDESRLEANDKITVGSSLFIFMLGEEQKEQATISPQLSYGVKTPGTSIWKMRGRQPHRVGALRVNTLDIWSMYHRRATKIWRFSWIKFSGHTG